jgi:hypothetical protein
MDPSVLLASVGAAGAGLVLVLLGERWSSRRRRRRQRAAARERRARQASDLPRQRAAEPLSRHATR